uniref:Uncharacterized protein n=1 Tax=Tetraselmis sp. GSL018 TaxID=582737 RepID=A0A061RKS0_9CHLO
MLRSSLSGPCRRRFMFWKFWTLLFLGAITPVSPFLVTKRHRQKVLGFDPTALDIPCATAECPPLENEVHLQKLNMGLRKYAPSQWACVEQGNWKFKHTTSLDFKEAFLKIIEYQSGHNYMERHLPVTTPLLVELGVKQPEQGDNNLLDFKLGFKLCFRLHSSLQGDPYAAPTEQRMTLQPWTPTIDDEWVAVHQWTNTDEDDTSDAALKDGAARLPPDEKWVIRRHTTSFVRSLEAAFRKAGSDTSRVEKLYFAYFGGPTDGIYELWAPVDRNVMMRAEAA